MEQNVKMCLIRHEETALFYCQMSEIHVGRLHECCWTSRRL